MAHKKQQQENTKLKEDIYKFLTQNAGDRYAITEKLLDLKMASSRRKIESAIDQLISEGRLLEKGKNIECNHNYLKQARAFSKDGKIYVVFSGNKERYLVENPFDFKIHNGAKVDVGSYLKVDKNRTIPTLFISEVEKKSEKIIVDEGSGLIYGRVMKTSGDELAFFANDKRFAHPIIITNDKLEMSKFQDKICILKIETEEFGYNQASGKIVEVKGDAGNPISEYEAIAASHGAVMSWDDDAFKEEIENAPLKVDANKYKLVSEDEYSLHKSEKDCIADLRALCFTTTDPVDCKDMDDAIFSTFDENGNLVIYTAVANVSKYINLNSNIGRQYLTGCFTTYSPNKAYNILPPQYSTNICSLNPNEDRLALVVKSVIDSKTGDKISDEIMDAIIESKGKYSYEKAQEICDKSSLSTTDLYKKIMAGKELTPDEQIIMNQKASKILSKNFDRRGSLQFESKDEYRVIFNEDMSDIEDIVPEDNCAYHKVIENFMVSANESTAKYALDNNIPNIFRVHNSPIESKTDRAIEFFGFLNIAFDGDLSVKGLRKVLALVKGTNKEKTVNRFLIRLQSKAKYSTSIDPEANKDVLIGKLKYQGGLGEEGISHFGLQSTGYSHSTSPIRRVPDYLTHYNILAHIHGEKPYGINKLSNIVEWANDMETQNKQAEREFQRVNSAIYCEHHIGDVMHGTISSFKRGKDSLAKDSIDGITVEIENEEKGIVVQVPLREVLASKDISIHNCALSRYGSAIVDAFKGTPILRICEDIDFKILSANRVSGQIEATTDVTREMTLEDYQNLENIPSVKPISRKNQRRLSNKEYKKHREDRER